MAFEVVCVSHTQESGGEHVARAVARELGYRYVDDEIIVRAARTAQVDPSVVAAAERKQPFLTRLFDAIAAATALGGTVAIAGGVVGDPMPWVGTATDLQEDLRVLIRAAILEVAANGNAVIGAHAASHALAGREGVLRVLVTAPEEVRAARLAASQSIDAATAATRIRESDAGREHYFQKFYGLRQELPTHYDLVVNTEVLAADRAAALVVAAATA